MKRIIIIIECDNNEPKKREVILPDYIDDESSFAVAHDMLKNIFLNGIKLN